MSSFLRNQIRTLLKGIETGDTEAAEVEYDFASSKVGFEVFRFEGDQVVEHWDTVEAIAPESEWKNDNGKF